MNELNTVVYTTKAVINQQIDSIIVILDEEGDWQVFNEGEELDDNAMIVSFRQICDLYPEVRSLIGIKKNSIARKNNVGEWNIEVGG